MWRHKAGMAKGTGERTSTIRVLRTTAASVAVAVLAWSSAPPASANPDPVAEYSLGPQDKVRLRVFEWRASKDEVFEWKALNDEYVVNAAGRIALPLVGEVDVNGMTTMKAARAISERLRSKMGFVQAPDAAVEVVKYRPFFITGAIDKPGEYPYRPGLTVLQAVTVAGGLFRASDAALMRLERESIGARGELALLEVERRALLARSARLTAELNDKVEIEFPSSLEQSQHDPKLVMLLSQEELIHKTRLKTFSNQVAALEKLREFLAKEIDSLGEQIKVHDRQVKSMRGELGNVKELVGKGLAVATRQSILERAEAQLQGDRLRLESSLMKARQELSRTEVAIVEMNSKRQTEVTTELRATQQKLEENEDKTETAKKLLFETEVIAPQYMTTKAGSRKKAPTYRIVRVRSGTSVETAAEESTAVEPGDTIKVEIPQLDAPSPGRLLQQSENDRQGEDAKPARKLVRTQVLRDRVVAK